MSDLVRLEIAAVASSLANSGLESFTVIVGIQLYCITFHSNCNTESLGPGSPVGSDPVGSTMTGDSLVVSDVVRKLAAVDFGWR